MTDRPTPRPEVPDVALRGGVGMPLLGLGTWQLRGSSAYEAVRTALDLGYRLVDTATMYRNEAEVGRAVRDSGIPRSDVVVTTKLAPGDADQPDRTIRRSLDALGLDQVDLWLVHWPPGGSASPRTWERFVAARDAGLTRAIGVSNYSLAQVDELERATGELPAVNQVEWGPSRYDADVAAGHRDRGVVLEGYSPFTSTDLRAPAIRRAADAHGRTAHQVVLRWHLQHGVVAIPKSGDPDRLAANLDVLGFSLDADQMAAIDDLGSS